MFLDNAKTVMLSDYILDKDKVKLKGTQNRYFGDGKSIEAAIANAYISYLSDQGISFSQEEAEYLSERIQKSLKNYKNKETKRINHN